MTVWEMRERLACAKARGPAPLTLLSLKRVPSLPSVLLFTRYRGAPILALRKASKKSWFGGGGGAL